MNRDVWYGLEYRIDRVDWNDACIRLRIRRPVVPAIVTFQRPVAGRLAGWRDDAWRVSLNRSLRVEDASVTAWHELAHVMQAERAGGLSVLKRRVARELKDARLSGANRRRFLVGRAYDRMPLELEAEMLAWDWHERLPLARSRYSQRHSSVGARFRASAGVVERRLGLR